MIDILKLTNKTLGKRLLPDTKYLLFKKFDGNRNPIFHVDCPKCLSHIRYTGANKDGLAVCFVCGIVNIKTSKVKFVTFNVESELNEVLERNKDNLIFQRAKLDDFPIRDVFDAEWNRKIYAEVGEFISLFMSTDGVQAFNSTKNSLWPIFVIVNNIAPHLRFRMENIICLGFFYGNNLNMVEYLESFAKDLDAINSGNGMYTKDHQNLKVFCVGASLDSVAKPKVINMKMFNGFCSCPYCYILGVRINHSTKFPFR